MRVVIRNIIFLFVFALTSSCTVKPKTELYLERGLDILSNKKQVNFILIDSIEIEQIGVIRDKKEHIKVVVLMMNPETDSMSLNGFRIGLRAEIKGDGGRIRTEQWDFEPKIVEVKSFRYLTKEIKLREDKIQKLSVFLYREIDTSEQILGNVLTLENLLTYND